MHFPKRNFDLITLGQMLLRLSPPGNERLARSDVFEKNVGGAELNVAVSAALLDLHTGVISRLPSHDIGQYMKSTVRSYGVSDDYFIYDTDPDARVGMYFYEYGAYPRKPQVIYDRRNSSFFSLELEQIDPKVYGDTACFHTSGITLALSEKLRETTIEAIKRFKTCGALYGLISSGGDVGKAVKYGNAVSAMKNTIPGDLPQSTLSEIDAVIEDHYSTGFHSEMKR